MALAVLARDDIRCATMRHDHEHAAWPMAHGPGSEEVLACTAVYETKSLWDQRCVSQ